MLEFYKTKVPEKYFNIEIKTMCMIIGIAKRVKRIAAAVSYPNKLICEADSLYYQVLKLRSWPAVNRSNQVLRCTQIFLRSFLVSPLCNNIHL